MKETPWLGQDPIPTSVTGAVEIDTRVAVAVTGAVSTSATMMNLVGAGPNKLQDLDLVANSITVEIRETVLPDPGAVEVLVKKPVESPWLSMILSFHQQIYQQPWQFSFRKAGGDAS